MRARSIVAITLLGFTLAGTSWAASQVAHHPTKAKPAAKAKATPPTGAGPQCAMMGGMSMEQMMSMMEGMHPAITADQDFVYVLRGNELLKLDKDSLQVLSQKTLPAPQMGGMKGSMSGGAGGGPGMSGMGVPADIQSLMNSMRQMTPSQFDRSYLQNMIAHHLSAITMSDLALKKATHRELRQFAQRVIDAQSRQNRQMTTWLKTWYSASPSAEAMPTDLQSIAQLKNLSGRDFEVRYMQAMIAHHQEAVQMAGMAEQKSQRPEIRTLASEIVDAQTQEISQLSNWLSDWYYIEANG